jgi:hypothetical protein
MYVFVNRERRKGRQDMVFSLILVPIRSGLRGFCLFILEISIGLSAKETAQIPYPASGEKEMIVG